MRKGGVVNEKNAELGMGGVSASRIPPIAHHKRERIKVYSFVLKAWLRCDGERIVAETKN